MCFVNLFIKKIALVMPNYETKSVANINDKMYLKKYCWHRPIGQVGKKIFIE